MVTRKEQHRIYLNSATSMVTRNRLCGKYSSYVPLYLQISKFPYWNTNFSTESVIMIIVTEAFSENDIINKWLMNDNPITY